MAHSQTKDRRVDVVSRAYPFTASPTDLSYHCSTLYITHTELKQEPGNILLCCWMKCMHELIHTYVEECFFFPRQYRNVQYPPWIYSVFLNTYKIIFKTFFFCILHSSKEIFSIVGFLRLALAQVSRWGYGYTTVNSSKIPRISKTLQLPCLPDNLNTPFIVFSF